MDIHRPRVCNSCGYNFWSNDVILLIRGCRNCFSNDVTPGVVILQQVRNEMSEPVKVDAILAERGARYGSFVENALLSQRLKQVMATGRSWEKLEAYQAEGLEMLAHKIARMLNGDHMYLDNIVDVIGFATLIKNEMERQNAKVEKS